EAHVAIRLAVDGVADLHVVGGGGLGDGARGGAGAEELAGHFLAGADLDDGAVLLFVEVDFEGFLFGGQLGMAVGHGVFLCWGGAAGARVAALQRSMARRIHLLPRAPQCGCRAENGVQGSRGASRARTWAMASSPGGRPGSAMSAVSSPRAR